MIDVIRENKYIKYALIIVGVIISLIYIKAFFTKGILFDDVFLKEHRGEGEIKHIGNYSGDEILITIDDSQREKGSVSVSYSLPEKAKEKYIVEFKEKSAYDESFYVVMKNDSGEILLEGSYSVGDRYLIEKGGKPYIGSPNIRVSNSNYENYNKYADYKISLVHVSKLALDDKSRVRGDAGYLFFAVFFIAITIVDIRHPLLFFRFKYCLSVTNPEPSELYVMLQRVSWVLYPLISLGLLSAAL